MALVAHKCRTRKARWWCAQTQTLIDICQLTTGGRGRAPPPPGSTSFMYPVTERGHSVFGAHLPFGGVGGSVPIPSAAVPWVHIFYVLHTLVVPPRRSAGIPVSLQVRPTRAGSTGPNTDHSHSLCSSSTPPTTTDCACRTTQTRAIPRAGPSSAPAPTVTGSIQNPRLPTMDRCGCPTRCA